MYRCIFVIKFLVALIHAPHGHDPITCMMVLLVVVVAVLIRPEFGHGQGQGQQRKRSEKQPLLPETLSRQQSNARQSKPHQSQHSICVRLYLFVVFNLTCAHRFEVAIGKML